MRGRRQLGIVAAVATLLAAAPLSAIFDKWTWLVQSAIGVALVAGAATLARWWRAPLWAQMLVMLGGLLTGLTWMFPSGGELLAVLPTPDTLAHFASLASASAHEMRTEGVPVDDTDPLLFVTVLGVSSVAVLVDLLVVGLRRPALAGLPMLAIYSVPVAVYVDSVPALPFAVGAVGFLWLLVADNVDRVRHFGRRFTGDGRDVDVWEPSPLAAAGRRLAVLGVAVAVLLPVAVPGMTSGLFDRFGSSGGNGTGQGGNGGQPGRVNLFAALSGELNRSEVRDLVKVRTDDTDPYYLRFAVADELRRNGFTIRNLNGVGLTQLSDSRSPQDGISYSAHRAEVEITGNFNMPFLPSYDRLVAVRNLDSSWLYDENMRVLYSNRNTSKGKKYSFDYVRAEFTSAALEAAEPLPVEDPIRRLYTGVPELVEEVEQTVAQLTRGKKTDYAKVRAIYDYFSLENGFSYSLSTQGGTSGQDIVNFLTNKVGFCQQYAAAMAWLVRAAGVPARVAFGFTNGTSPRDGVATLTNLNLHAWTEVYFAGAGWVPFDATPAANVPGSTRSDWAPDTNAPDPVTPSAGPSGGPGSTDPGGPNVAEREQRAVDENAAGAPGAPGGGGPRWPWLLVASILALLALLALPALRRVLLRRHRSRPVPGLVTTAPVGAGEAPVPKVVPGGTDPHRARADAHAAWDELIDTMVDFGIRVDPAETPRSTTGRLVAGGLTGTAADAARLLGRAEERARYARDPLSSGALAESLRSVHRTLRAAADRRTRMLAVALPPSVLLRWRLAVMDRSGRLVATGGRVRDSLLRWNPRRLLAGRAAR